MTFGNSINERKLIDQLQQRRRVLIDRAVDEPSQDQRDDLLAEIDKLTKWSESLQKAADWEAELVRLKANADEQDQATDRINAQLSDLGKQLA